MEHEKQHNEEKHEKNVEHTHKHKTHHTHAKSIPVNKGSLVLWQVATGMLLVLLVVSILTQGFTINNSEIDLVIAQINDLEAKANNDDAIQQFELVKQQLFDIKSVMENDANTGDTPGVDEPDVPSTNDVSSEVPSTSNGGDTAELEFYVMSQCPYGTQVENAIAPVLDRMGDAVDFNLYFIGSGDVGSFSSLHGENEVQGDKVQVCAIKYEPDTYMNMIVCMNKNAQDIPNNWEDCATKVGMDVETIRTCYEGDEADQLLKASFDHSAEMQASGSPTIYLNGERYAGGRGEMDFARAICAAIDNNNPECANIPEPVNVPLIYLTDKRCGPDCDARSVVAQLNMIFPGLNVTELDYSSEEGKKVYEESDITALPALLFGQEVKDGEGYNQISKWLDEAGDYYSLRIGASFDPTAEICDNGIDDTGNGDVDCNDSQCDGAMECREEIENSVDLFVMSKCPYGILAMNSMKEVLETFPDLNFQMHYIARQNADGTFNSLHGQGEVDEDIRELCVMDAYPDSYMDYIWCRNENIESTDWESCLTDEMDSSTVKECAEGDKGKELLGEDIKIGQQLQVSASPTWLANNRYVFNAIDAETVRKNICDHNPDLDGCDKTLSSNQQVPSGSCG